MEYYAFLDALSGLNIPWTNQMHAYTRLGKSVAMLPYPAIEAGMHGRHDQYGLYFAPHAALATAISGITP